MQHGGSERTLIEGGPLQDGSQILRRFIFVDLAADDLAPEQVQDEVQMVEETLDGTRKASVGSDRTCDSRRIRLSTCYAAGAGETVVSLDHTVRVLTGSSG